jgi:LmbE family N-acetylglucosaminyl deacetylase
LKILVVVAHPDDEVLGCGATMARLAREGNEIKIAILAEGITSRARTRKEAEQSEVVELKKHAKRAASMLGVNAVSFHGLPDNRLDTVPLLEVAKVVEELIVEWQPHRIYTHHTGDLNLDHTVVSRAVMIATRPMAHCPVKGLYQFEVPSSTEWAFQQFEPVFRPNVFFDVSATLDAKLKAMACYGTETRKFPHPRSPEVLTAIARRWGSVAGVTAAEAFQLVREIG